MRFEIICIVWKRINRWRFDSFEERSGKGAISRRESGRIRLEFYHQGHHVDVRRCLRLGSLSLQSRYHQKSRKNEPDHGKAGSGRWS
jgi:hypothetical protein